jgi:hypothetical protein
LKKSHALRQCLSEPLGEETPKKKVGNCPNKEEREKKVVKVIDHQKIGGLKFQMANLKCQKKPGRME